MDLRSEFKDLNLDSEKDNFDDGEKIVKDLEERLAQLKRSEPLKAPEEKKQTAEVLDEVNGDEEEAEEETEEEDEDMGESTFLEKIQPFILPIALTFFAIIFAAMFLYFFSKSRVENTAQAIVNAGVPEQVYYPPTPVPVIIKEEPLTCELPQILNEDASACITPEPEPEPVIVKPEFENGTTTEVDVSFSYDKYNYDNYPRGIYLLEGQVFSGDFENYKINANNRAFANDYFFGVDRNTVSLIGSCSYVVDDAKILVKNMNLNESKKHFTGEVVKVIEASKPRIDCAK